jgi:hypothetical protein
MNVDRERIRKQSKEVAAYMAKPKKYHVEWDCPHCGNSHNWWWEDEFEAYDDKECDMFCDRCDTRVRCVGDGNGFYEPVRDEKQRLEELESLELDLHNYVRGLEDKVNTNNKLAFDAINTVTMRLIELENTVAQRRSELDNLGGRMTQAELAVWRLENDIKEPGSAKLGPQHVELAKEKEREEYRSPEKGDMWVSDDDPTVMKVFTGTGWLPVQQDSPSEGNTDAD